MVTAAKRVKPSYLSRMCGDGYGYVFQKQVQCSAHHYFPNTLAIYLFINVHFISAFSLLDSKVSMRGNWCKWNRQQNWFCGFKREHKHWVSILWTFSESMLTTKKIRQNLVSHKHSGFVSNVYVL